MQATIQPQTLNDDDSDRSEFATEIILTGYDRSQESELQATANSVRAHLAAVRKRRATSAGTSPMAGLSDAPETVPQLLHLPDTISFEITYEQILKLMLACDASPARITINPTTRTVTAYFPFRPYTGNIPIDSKYPPASQSEINSLELRALDEIGRIAITRSIKSEALDLDVTDYGKLHPHVAN
jgi:hypothetical protein